MRLIDADKVNETIDRFIGYLDEDMILRIKMKISAIPTADRPHGEWENCGGIFCARCSVCKEVAYETVGNFCPNCGADMSANDRQVTGKLNSEIEKSKSEIEKSKSEKTCLNCGTSECELGNRARYGFCGNWTERR